MSGQETTVEFFPGLHQPSDAHRFERACICIRRLWRRKKPLGGVKVIVDSGAFMELLLHGEYRESVEAYAGELSRLYTHGIVNIVVAVSQDFMCEDFMLARTGATNAALADLPYGPAPRSDLIALHQKWTIERYDALKAALSELFPAGIPFPVMPVLQGYAPADYLRHVAAYGPRLTRGMWVGVGSVCKRNSQPKAIADVLAPLARFGFRLHGFGVKLTALLSAQVRRLLASADSMAWSYSARKQGRSANDWREAMSFVRRIEAAVNLPFEPYQLDLWSDAA